jgi:hypothetical protein
LGQSVGPAVQEEIALTLQPLVAEFRQHVVQAVREQTAQAFQASGWKAA